MGWGTYLLSLEILRLEFMHCRVSSVHLLLIGRRELEKVYSGFGRPFFFFSFFIFYIGGTVMVSSIYHFA